MAKSTRLTQEEMNDVLYHKDRFVVLDIETTALSPHKGGKIIEVAAVRVVNGEKIEEYTSFIDPEQKISKKTTELTGITQEMVKGQRLYHIVLRELYQFIGDDIVVAHNSTFDWDTYLVHYFLQIGIIPKNLVIDTLPLSKLYLPNNPNHKLNTICEAIGVKLENHHRAIYDTRATADVLIHFKNHFCKADNGTYRQEMNHIQGDLFNLDVLSDVAATNEEAVKEEKTLIEVKRVKYWEMQKSKKEVIRRIYVTLNIGSCYFDVNKKAWFNKDISTGVDFNDVQANVLQKLKLRTVEDLTNFRN